MTVVRRVVAAAGIATLTALLLFTGWAWLAGWRLNVVESGSMTPLLQRNSLAVVVPTYGPAVGEGDVVVFADRSRGGVQVMHRVVRVIEQGGGRFYETKGDANAVPDRWLVPAAQVHGRLVFQLAHAGAALRALAFPRGAVVLVGVPLLIGLVGEVRDSRRRRVRGVCPTCGAAAPATRSPRRIPVGWPTPSVLDAPGASARHSFRHP